MSVNPIPAPGAPFRLRLEDEGANPEPRENGPPDLPYNPSVLRDYFAPMCSGIDAIRQGRWHEAKQSMDQFRNATEHDDYRAIVAMGLGRDKEASVLFQKTYDSFFSLTQFDSKDYRYQSLDQVAFVLGRISYFQAFLAQTPEEKEKYLNRAVEYFERLATQPPPAAEYGNLGLRLVAVARTQKARPSFKVWRDLFKPDVCNQRTK